MTNGKLIVFSAPSGSGKTTIVKHLLTQNNLPLAFSVSATTRAPRPNETDGKDYYFLSVDEFKSKIENDHFLEWEEVYPNQFYGTLKSELERLWAEGKTVLFDIDVAGGLAIKTQFPKETLAIFVQPPTFELLVQRLSDRSTEGEQALAKRIAKAPRELEQAANFDVILVNDTLDLALRQAVTLADNFINQQS